MGVGKKNLGIADKDTTRRFFKKQPVSLNSHVLQTGGKDVRKI
jgi:hypothetical protein